MTTSGADVVSNATVGQSALRRGEGGILARATNIYCIVVALYHIVYVSGILSMMGIFVPGVLHRAVSLTLIGALVFILNPITKRAPGSRLRWIDYFLAFLTLVAAGYAAYGYDHLTDLVRVGRIDLISTVVAFVAIALILEGTRRVLGLAMPLIALIFIVATMLSNYLPGVLEGRGYGFDRMAMQLFVLGDAGIYGSAMAVASTLVVMFIIFSQFVQNSAAGQFMIDAALSLMGHVRGGPAKAAVLASAAFGTISGSTLANVVAVGTMTIPLIKKVGYQPHMAGAIEAVASNGGQIMPPVMGIVAFLIAEYLGIPYYAVCLAAVIPAILYFLALFIMIDLEAGRSNIRGLPRSQLPSFKDTLKSGWYYTLPVIALIFMIGVLKESPERSALYAIIILLVIVTLLGKGRRMGIGTIGKSLAGGIKGSTQVMMACATAGIVVGCIGITNLGIRLSASLIDIAAGNVFVLLVLTAVVSYLLGFVASSIAVYVMLVLLIAPALVDQGILPISAHLFVFYWGLTAMITPPECIAAYAAGAIAGAHPFKVGFTAMRLSIVLYVLPFVWIYAPALVFQGSPGEILLATITAVIGTSGISAGLAGYFLKRTMWFERVLFIGSGLAILVPILPVALGGLGLLVASGILHWRRRDVARVVA